MEERELCDRCGERRQHVETDWCIQEIDREIAAIKKRLREIAPSAHPAILEPLTEREN